MTYLLTLQINVDREEATLHGSAEGLRTLASRLEALARIAEQGTRDHVHLMSAAWGGGELAGDPPGSPPHAAAIVQKLSIYGWPDGGVESQSTDPRRDQHLST